MTIVPPSAVVGFLLTVLLWPSALHAQQQTRAGPVIESAGAVFSVDPDMSMPRDRDYRLAFEVAAPSPSADRPNTASTPWPGS